MAAQARVFLIADIAGYTRFMNLHRLSLAHSQDVTARLLDAMVTAVPKLELVEIEGDAAFFASSYEEGEEDRASAAAIQDTLTMYNAFHARRLRMTAANICNCDGCRQAGQLKVKFVVHAGEAEKQTIQRHTKLVGVDVIAVHRMLKNDVPVPEYLLMSDRLFEHSDPNWKEKSRPITLELEGLGEAQSYFVNVAEVAPQEMPVPKVAMPTRVAVTMGVMMRSMPRFMGLARPRADRSGL